MTASSTTATTAQSLLQQVAKALVSFGETAASPGNITALLAALGWEPPPGIDLVAAIRLDLTGLATALSNVVDLTASDADAATLAEAYVTLAKDVAELIAAADSLAQSFPSVMAAAGNYVTATQIEAEFVPRLLDLIIVTQLAQGSSLIFALLNWLGIIELQHFAADHTVYQVDHDRAIVHYDRIPTLVTRPVQLFELAYGWNTAEFDATSFIAKLCALLQACWLPARLVTAPAGLLSSLTGQPADQAISSSQALLGITGGTPDASFEAGVAILPVGPTGAGTDAGIGIVPYLFGTAALSLSPLDGLTLTLDASLDLESGAGLVIRPTGTTLLGNVFGQGAPAVQASGGVSIESDYQPTAAPLTLLSVDGGCVILCQKLACSVGATAGAQNTDFSFGLTAAGSFRIGTQNADGFLTTILPTDSSSTQFEVSIEWSQLTGFHFVGAASTRLVIPVHQDLGPLYVDSVTLALQAANGDAQLIAAVTAGFELGPIAGTVQNVGIFASLEPRADHQGNLGPVDIRGGFQPPDGIGLGIGAPVVSGGGFLAFDEANGRYLGALALSAGPVSVQGVGVLTTKLPGGGWSLIALANVDGLALQLGFGIELTGLGVLVGVNRTMNVAALQSLARSGGLTTVMFPADLAANAPRVAADLDGLFPAARGQYVFGPTVQLTWGTGSLITGELAVYVELPSPLRVAVLGALQVMLPDPDEPVVQLNLDLLGVIDLTAKTVALDMSLAHSALAGMPLTGQAALRAGWGDQPAFLLAAGGWHPSFVAPAGFPVLQRIGLSMGGGDLQLRLAAYLAVTTNTVQLGAAIDLRAVAGPAAFTATVSFDALVQFKPFGLELDLAICAAVTLGGDPVLSLNITVHLSGPSPWHMAGQAQFSILWFSFTVPISGTFGNAVTPVAPAPADIFGPLAAAVADPHSWVLPSPPGPPVVTLRNGSAGAAVHPLGSLTLQQRVIPLEQHIDRFGADLLPAPTVVSLSAGGASTSANGVPGMFAPAQYVTMTDAQKLSAPSFQALTAGFTIGAAGLVVPVAGGISATSPQAAPACTPSDAAWDPLVIDCSPVPAAAGAAGAPAGGSPVRTIVISAPAGMQVPGEVLAAQLPDAAAAVCGTAAMGAGAYPRIRTGIGPQLPQYAIASLGMVNQTQDRPWFGAQVAAAAAAGPGQQAVYLSELSSG